MSEEPVRLPAAMPSVVARSSHVRPVRKDELEVPELGLLIESWLPERRSRRRPLLLIHGELGGSWVWHRLQEYLASRGWEAHALNLRGHYWSDTTELEQLDFAAYLQDVAAARERLGREVVLVGHGMGGLLALAAAAARPPAGLILLGPALPAELRVPAKGHELREIPAVYRRDLIGWQALPEQLRRQNPDLTIADVERVQHLLGAESGAARRDVLLGVSVDAEPLLAVPRLVVGGGLDRLYPEADTERLAAWLDAEYQPFGAHSHFGLVAGDDSHAQVGAAMRQFLEAHRL